MSSQVTLGASSSSSAAAAISREEAPLRSFSSREEEVNHLLPLFFERISRGETPVFRDVFECRALASSQFLLHSHLGWCECSSYPNHTRIRIAHYLVEKFTSDLVLQETISKTHTLTFLFFGTGFGLQSLLELFLILESRPDLQTLHIVFSDLYYKRSDYSPLYAESAKSIRMLLKIFAIRYHISFAVQFVYEIPEIPYDFISCIDVLYGQDDNTNIPACMDTFKKVLELSPHARLFASFKDPADLVNAFPCFHRCTQDMTAEAAEKACTTLFFGKLSFGLHLLDRYFPAEHTLFPERTRSSVTIVITLEPAE